MTFIKGKSGNPGGREAGSVSKKTLILKTFTETIIEGRMDRFNDELDKLEGRAYVDAFLSLLEYVKPRLARTELSDSEGNAVTINVRVQSDNEKI